MAVGDSDSSPYPGASVAFLRYECLLGCTVQRAATKKRHMKGNKNNTHFVYKQLDILVAFTSFFEVAELVLVAGFGVKMSA
ncbi:MAG: hypothetical protein GY820_14645 [Gammaproteobacteria bacterium]|nr:hypothetical protein [Gammaproteobacteria bacterium]MCP4488537.1 hypothetical protein [Gammaproteobacteria bacterium]